MRRSISTLIIVLLVSALFVLPSTARTDSKLDLDHINVQYYGGPLIQHVRVSTLFWGRYWSQNRLADYFNGFFDALFADGRYMANLAQYSAGGYQIGDGEFVATTTDPARLPARVTDEQIQAEIRAQVKAGALPRPGQDTLYVVFTSPHVLVKAGHMDSEHDFAGYHSYFWNGRGGGFAYAVIVGNPDNLAWMQISASHELAEAVTDPQPSRGTYGWVDDRNGEIGDIPIYLYLAGRIGWDDLVDSFEAPDGTVYLVEKPWSIQDRAPMAFAHAVAQ